MKLRERVEAVLAGLPVRRDLAEVAGVGWPPPNDWFGAANVVSPPGGSGAVIVFLDCFSTKYDNEFTFTNPSGNRYTAISASARFGAETKALGWEDFVALVADEIEHAIGRMARIPLGVPQDVK